MLVRVWEARAQSRSPAIYRCFPPRPKRYLERGLDLAAPTFSARTLAIALRRTACNASLDFFIHLKPATEWRAWKRRGHGWGLAELDACFADCRVTTHGGGNHGDGSSLYFRSAVPVLIEAVFLTVVGEGHLV